MKRDEEVAELRAARKELHDALVGFSEEDLVRPNAIGKWSIKDLLAHIASWDEEILRVIQAFAMQPEPHYSTVISDRNDFSVWNQEQIEARREQSLQQTMAEFENARRDLIQVTEGVTDQVLGRPKLTSWGAERTGFDLLNETTQHDLDHAVQIRSWRKKRDRWQRARQKYAAKRRVSKD